MEKEHVTAERWEHLIESEKALAAVMTLDAGEVSDGNPHHGDSQQWLYVIDGSGSVTIEGREVPLEEGDLVLIEEYEPHEVKGGDERLKTLNFYVPPGY